MAGLSTQVKDIDIVFKIVSFFVPILVFLVIYIYQRQVKILIDKIDDLRDTNRDHNLSIKELYATCNYNCTEISKSQEQIKAIEIVCKLKHHDNEAK